MLGLASPANGDVCFDTVLGTTLYYSAGWKTFVNTGRTISTTAPLSGGGDLSANRTLSISAGGLVYSSVTGAGKGALGAATVYLVGPGVVAVEQRRPSCLGNAGRDGSEPLLRPRNCSGWRGYGRVHGSPECSGSGHYLHDQRGKYDV